MVMRSRRKGAAIGLIAIVTLVVFVVGLVVFLLIKVVGGSREATNASDAGTLNVAKSAMLAPGIDVPKEFEMCAVPEGSPITLLTYNRCLAQAILVALNAHELGTSQAKDNARQVLSQIEQLGRQLKNEFNDLSIMDEYFHPIANANNLKMLGQNNILSNDISCSYMKPGESTNVYFDPETLPIHNRSDLLKLLPYSSGKLKGPQGQPYLAGYTPIVVDGIKFFGVPVFPQQRPHLVAKADFDKALQPPSDSVPPNAFEVKSSVKEPQSAKQLHMLACAIVGAVNPENGPRSDFAAAIPGGYLEFVNLPGRDIPADWQIEYDASLSIFNREIYVGIDVSSNKVFSLTTGEMEAWVAYNTSTGGDANGHDPVLFPPSLGFPLPGTLRTGGRFGQQATLADALAIRDSTNCDPEKYDYSADNVCAAAFGDLLGNYGRAPTFRDPKQGPPIKYMNLEVAKAQVFDAFSRQSTWYVDVEPLKLSPSGLRKFDHFKKYPNPDVQLKENEKEVEFVFDGEIAFSEDGTIMELIKQSTTCPDKVIAEIVQRSRQIVPGTPEKDILQLLDTKLPIGENNEDFVLYLYQKSGKLVVSKDKPRSFMNAKPDSRDDFAGNCAWNGCNSCMQVSYRADGLTVNTSKHMKEFKKKDGTKIILPIPGDAGSLEQLFLTVECPRGVECPGLWAYDRADWRPATGAKNLLGRLEFSNHFVGAGGVNEAPKSQYTFTHPN